MTFTPHITIYPEGDFDYRSFGDSLVRATLIFSKYLTYNKTLARKRVNIHLGEENRIFTKKSIKSIWIKNTIDITNVSSDADRVNLFLKIIYQSLLAIAEVEGWETTAFAKTYQLSLADKGNFIWYTAFKTNRNKSLKARIRISLHDEGKVPIVAEFFDKKSNYQFEILIIDTFLHFVNWYRLFEKPNWFDNEKFGFNFLDSQLLIFTNSSLRQSETIILEKKWSREEIEARLKQLTYKRFGNNRELAEWGNK